MMTENYLYEILRRSGQKATSSRLSVLELLRKSKNPLSARNIISLLGNKMDQATVYRILKVFKEKGLIQQIDLRHNHAHYEIFRKDEHHHLICSHCGKLENIHHCNLDHTYSAILKSSKHFSEINQHSLEFYGVCKTCKNIRHEKK